MQLVTVAGDGEGSTSARSPLVNTPDLKTPLPYHDYGDVEELRAPTAVVNP